MTATLTPEVLTYESINPILRSPGPCITILLPAYHPGEPASSPAALLRSHIQVAAQKLSELGLTKAEATDLLQPVERLTQASELAGGSRWARAIFRSPTVFAEFPLVHPVQAGLTVAGSFAVRKVAQELAGPSAFYILAISQKKISLMRCMGLDLEVTPLPHGVPDTLEEMLALDRLDNDLENRSSAGHSTGSMHAVRFGTGSAQEQEHGHLANYYKLVDRGLQTIFRESGMPLILAGVNEDTAIYKANSSYRHLVTECVAGNMDVLRDPPTLLRQAYAILRKAAIERQVESLADAMRRFAPPRFETDPDAVLEAAFKGRVGQIYLNEGKELARATSGQNYRAWAKEDLLNVASVQVLIHHGKSCELPSGRMPDGVAVVGIMRY